MRLAQLVVGAAALGALGASAGSAPRPGKVVRIERAKRLLGTPRFCALSPGDLDAYCFGKRPELGDQIIVVDQRRVVATLRVERTEAIGQCVQSAQWITHTRIESGDFQTAPDQQVAGLLDVVVDPRQAHLEKVDRVPGDRPLSIEQVVGVDTDGDGNVDLAFEAFSCDDAGVATQLRRAGQCIEVWSASGHGLSLLRTDRVGQSCFSRVSMNRRDLLAAERGTLYKEAETRIALVYPSPYRAAMSSLGYQQIYRTLHAMPQVAADRAMLPEPEDREATFVTLETGRPVGGYPMLAYSVAYELEIAGMIQTLELASVPVLRDDREPHHPIIVAGGPLTFSNPAPLAPFCDVIIVGEGEQVMVELVTIAREVGFDRTQLLAALAGKPGYYLPSHGEHVPPVAAVDDALLPARSVIATPHTELADMFMTEAARGCSRGCTYCVMRRSTNGGMRIVPRETIIAGIPRDARRVGLVGAAVTDHPDIRAIVRDVVDGNRAVGISSLRADKLDDELVGLLARGGYRTLTVAADGASERMRRVVERSTRSDHLLRSAELARAHRLTTLKVYMMLGVPGETDDDVDELVALSKELAAIHPKVAYGLAPFVAKRNTPLDGTAFAGISVVEQRLARLRRGLTGAGLGGKVEVRPTSARWAWVEYMLAQGESIAGLAVLDAYRAGGSFAAYRKAFEARGVAPTGPRARVPSSQELIALRKKRLAS